jgi:trans-aconitate methyltransferase
MSIDWKAWLARWDEQQTGYFAGARGPVHGNARCLGIHLARTFHRVGFGLRPGSISQRILTRFPKAQCIAVDLDPDLLTMGQNVLGNMNGRLRWVEASLLDSAWLGKLTTTHVDTVLSSTALHWLPAPDLVRVYSQLGRFVQPGGGGPQWDHMPSGPHLPTFSRIAQAWKDRIQYEAFTGRGGENWTAWWQALEKEPEMHALITERRRRFQWHTDQMSAPSYKMTDVERHLAALQDAGFR